MKKATGFESFLKKIFKGDDLKRAQEIGYEGNIAADMGYDSLAAHNTVLDAEMAYDVEIEGDNHVSFTLGWLFETVEIKRTEKMLA